MEFGLKEILFGLAGVSMVAWAGVIGLWHTYMFPRFFKEDSSRINSSSSATSVAQSAPENSGPSKPWFLDDEGGSLTPQTALGAIGLTDRGKYSKKSFVVADFNPVEAGYGVNRLYSSVLIGLAISTFVIICFGLQSGFGMMGPTL
ncbi:hypothetical protein [Prochlorococcus sp. MIT 1011]|uniref:hypothetical protein n=1 Tax=Prochlorococcus sp. MIT 1011 TaxID=3082520 RepID=UPI0039B43DE8